MADFAVSDVFKVVDEMAPQFGFTPNEVKTILLAENTGSGKLGTRKTYSGDATNSNKTMGIMQVIPTTAEGLKQAGFLPQDWKHDPNNVRSQLMAGMAAMKEMRSRQRNPSDLLELGAMYNGGNVPWEQYKSGKPMNPETTNYLQKMRTSMAELNMTPQQIEAMAGKPGGISLPAGTRLPSRSSSSSSTSTSSKSYDPAAMANVQQAMGLLQNPGGLLDTAMGALSDRSADVATTGASLMEGILSAGRAAGASAEAAAVLKASGEARRAALLTRANLNPEQTNNRMDQALSELDVTSAMLDQMKPEIDQRLSVGFFDNPLEYVVNMTRLPGMISKYNTVVGTQQNALNKYSAAKDIATSSIDMSQAIDADQTLAVGAAVSKEQFEKAKMEVDKTKLALQSKSAAEALQAVQLGMSNVDLTLKQLMLNAQTQATREGLSEREAAEAGEKAALSQFNVMIEAAGGEKIAPDRFKQLTAAQRSEILATTSSRRFGGDFVSALKFVETYGNLDAMAVKGQANVRTWVNNTNNLANAEVSKMQTEAEAKGKGTQFNPGKAKEAAFQAIASQYQASANGNMRGVPEGNPYKIDYKTIVKDPQFAGNSYVQLMAKYGPDGTEPQFQDFDEQNFIRRAATVASMSADPALATKKFAADISSFYKTASRATQMANKPQLFGLSTPAKTYPVILPGYQTGKEVKSIDLGDQTLMENFMTQQVARHIALEKLSMFAVGEKLQEQKALGLKMFGGN